MKVRLTKIDRGFGSEVYVWGRDETGRKYSFPVFDFRPYIYVDAAEPLDDKAVTSSEWGFTSIFGDELRKIYLSNPSEAPRVRELVNKTWEADIPYARRYAIDNHLQGWFDGENLKPCEPGNISLLTYYFDIECYSEEEGMPDPERDKVTCISIRSNKGQLCTLVLDEVDMAFQPEENKSVTCFKDEKSLIEIFLKLINRCDVAVAWNLPFDVEYLEKRAKKLGISNFRFEGVCPFDLYEGYRKLYRRPVYKLKNIAVVEGFAGTVDEVPDYNDLYDNHRDDLIALNQKHVTWLSQIDEKLKIVDYFWSLKELAGLENLEDTLHTSTLIDAMILRRAKGALPTKEKKEGTTYEGGYVATPPKGVFDSVADFDMSRFYPNVLLSEKLDPIILDAYMKEHSGKVDWTIYKPFADAWQGDTIILGLTSELIAMRDRMQKEGHLDKVAAIKGIVNGLYGVLAFPGFRLHKVEIPERVTETARNIIKELSTEIGKQGFKVLYNDTDSAWVSVPKEGVKEVELFLNSYLAKLGTYTIKLENYFSRVIFLGVKKRYAGKKENGELEIVGFERVKSDSSQLTKDVQENVLRLILEGKEAEVLPYLQGKVLEVKSAGIDTLATVKQLGKDLSEYTKGEQGYIKEIKRRKFLIRAGDSVSIVPAKNYPFGVAVWQEKRDLEKPVEVNFEEVLEKQVRAKVEDLLEVIGSSWGEVQGQVKLF